MATKTILTVNGKTIMVSAKYAGTKESFNPAYCHHIVTVTIDGARASFDYWASKASPQMTTDQDLRMALECFCGDAMAGEMDFHDFCGEFGYEEYTEYGKRDHKSYGIYSACVRTAKKAARIGLDCADVSEYINDQ